MTTLPTWAVEALLLVVCIPIGFSTGFVVGIYWHLKRREEKVRKPPAKPRSEGGNLMRTILVIALMLAAGCGGTECLVGCRDDGVGWYTCAPGTLPPPVTPDGGACVSSFAGGVSWYTCGVYTCVTSRASLGGECHEVTYMCVVKGP